MGPRCSFCGTSTGPFNQVGGMFPLLMCSSCQAVRSAPAPEPAELVVLPDLAEPWLQYGCPLAGCHFRCSPPWDLEQHTAAEHPGWTATFEATDLWRVVYRRQDA